MDFTVDEIHAIMQHPSQIRNLSVISHIGHGKSTLTDILVAEAGITGAAGESFPTADQQEQYKRSKATPILLPFNMAKLLSKEVMKAPTESTSHDFLVNLIDTPGHTDYSSEVAAALYVSDGALVVVDCIEGVCKHTEVVLQWALSERVKPVLVVNKMDRALMELQQGPEETYQSLLSIIQTVNVVISTYADNEVGDMVLYPEQGTVVFGSGQYSWAFALTNFAKMYAKKFGVDEEKMCKKLWGDNFFDSKQKHWTSEARDGCQRAFCQFCLEPIQQLLDAVMSKKKDKLEKMLKSLNIVLKEDEKDLTEKGLLKCIMQKFLPAAEALLMLIVMKLPNPKQAQSYRVEQLYTDARDSEHFQGAKNCDPKGPLLLYVSKMVPQMEKKGRMIAFGRVFSGIVRTGMKVRIMGSDYTKGGRTDLFVKTVHEVVLVLGKQHKAVKDLPCGNLVGLVGVDPYILKTATITEEEYKDVTPLRHMTPTVSRVVSVSVEPINPLDLPQLVEGLKRLTRTDLLVQCGTEESGTCLISGAGELHLETCLKHLQEEFMSGEKLRISDLLVKYRETVTGKSDRTCLAKSPNKHNRLYCKGAPLTEELSQAIEMSKVHANMDPKVRECVLTEDFGWNREEARRIWCFGPCSRGPNILVDMTRGVQYVSEIKDAFITAWNWVTKCGVLCEEEMRGVRVNIEDVTLQSDTIHRGSGQIIPTARRVCFACFLTAGPAIMEPVYRVDIQTVEHAVDAIRSVLSRRRGVVLHEESRKATPVCKVAAYLPVAESSGFTADLQFHTGGQSVAQCVFDHWVLLPSDPLSHGSIANEIVVNVRRWKGEKEEIPDLTKFSDRL